jgi:hypothetical protein
MSYELGLDVLGATPVSAGGGKLGAAADRHKSAAKTAQKSGDSLTRKKRAARAGKALAAVGKKHAATAYSLKTLAAKNATAPAATVAAPVKAAVATAKPMVAQATKATAVKPVASLSRAPAALLARSIVRGLDEYGDEAAVDVAVTDTDTNSQALQAMADLGAICSTISDMMDQLGAVSATAVQVATSQTAAPSAATSSLQTAANISKLQQLAAPRSALSMLRGDLMIDVLGDMVADNSALMAQGQSILDRATKLFEDQSAAADNTGASWNISPGPAMRATGSGATTQGAQSQKD